LPVGKKFFQAVGKMEASRKAKFTGIWKGDKGFLTRSRGERIMEKATTEARRVVLLVTAGWNGRSEDIEGHCHQQRYIGHLYLIA